MDSITQVLEEVHQKLKRAHPHLDFLYFLMPVHKEEMVRFGAHEVEEIEKRVVAAAGREFANTIKEIEMRRDLRARVERKVRDGR